MRRSKGFTLIEVLSVVMIIGVLASLVIPRFTGQAERARAAEAVNIMGAIRHGVMSYYDEHLHWPGDISSIAAMESTLGIIVPTSAYGWTFKTVRSADGAHCSVVATITVGETLSLDVVSGAWNGTGNYSAGTGKFWPYLPVAGATFTPPVETPSGDGNVE